MFEFDPIFDSLCVLPLLLLDQLPSLKKSWREKAGGKKAGEKNLEKKAGEKKFGEEKSVEKKAAEENPSAVCFYAHKQHQVGQFIWLLVTGDPSPNQILSRIISNFIWNCKRAAAMDL